MKLIKTLTTIALLSMIGMSIYHIATTETACGNMSTPADKATEALLHHAFNPGYKFHKLTSTKADHE
jgi:hypothetical protein